ncbi:MAG: periplasmic heavy metal sensor [Elusimicrobia bacterium]|nr:periplasmic heavy metal sensor [Candidatus Obscuribacterium magneticum]
MKIQWNQIIISLLLGLVIGTFAGPWLMREFFPRHMGHHGEPQRKMLDMFSKQLGLDQDQKIKVGKIFEAHRPEMDAVFSESRAKFNEIRKITSQEIKAILTPEQQKKFDALEDEMNSRDKKQPFPPPPPR